ncbi:hypothetical protein PsorP6_001155 [Peronosclerospora sorghi]|uniref:Uncharacterized protein n=1 Tax=Peronosclerospora sorghi TaxID=230839 RepID=A0ACC0WYF9_9STRA|nr:hypothetical protein PsorP6_001155 [Peronosclerospora sorghi]
MRLDFRLKVLIQSRVVYHSCHILSKRMHTYTLISWDGSHAGIQATASFNSKRRILHDPNQRNRTLEGPSNHGYK